MIFRVRSNLNQTILWFLSLYHSLKWKAVGSCVYKSRDFLWDIKGCPVYHNDFFNVIKELNKEIWVFISSKTWRPARGPVFGAVYLLMPPRRYQVWYWWKTEQSRWWESQLRSPRSCWRRKRPSAPKEIEMLCSSDFFHVALGLPWQWK